MFLASSCSVTTQTMREPNTRVELHKEDFIISKQYSATATTTRVLGIDFSRLFKHTVASVDHDGYSTPMFIPFIGGLTGAPSVTENYALFQLMTDNPGYDVIFYPQFSTNHFSFLGLYSKETVKVNARMAKFSATKKNHDQSFILC